MPKLFHTPKSNIIGPFFILPLFLYLAYEGIVHSIYLLSIGSLVFWFLLVLFTINYWIQTFVLLIATIITFYFGYWQAGVFLVLLSLYMVNAARMAESGELGNLDLIKDRLPLTEGIIDALQDKKKTRIIIIILVVISLIASFISMKFIK